LEPHVHIELLDNIGTIHWQKFATHNTSSKYLL
jgi:hypothetical protein